MIKDAPFSRSPDTAMRDLLRKIERETTRSRPMRPTTGSDTAPLSALMASALVTSNTDTGLIAQSDVILRAGTLGPWTEAGYPWQLSVNASVGDILEWTPAVALGGGPAAIDVVCMDDSTPIAYAATETDSPNDFGLLYTRGDYGAARLDTIRWTVAAEHVVGGHVTLTLAYRSYTEASGQQPMLIGHPVQPSRIWLTNCGPVQS